MLATLTTTGRALVDPAVGVGVAVEGRRFMVPLVALSIAVALSGAAYALKLDAERLVIPKLAMKGDLARTSEREIDDQVQQAQRLALVAGVAKGLALMPLAVLFLALALKLVAWLLVRPIPFVQLFTVAAVAMLPIALYHLVYAAALWRQEFVTVASAEALVPSSLASLVSRPGPLQRAAGAVDFFWLWAVGLLGLGLARAAKWKAWRGLLLALFLYACFVSAFRVGLPGLLEGLGDGPPRGRTP